jgi:hypothetical protein
MARPSGEILGGPTYRVHRGGDLLGSDPSRPAAGLAVPLLVDQHTQWRPNGRQRKTVYADFVCQYDGVLRDCGDCIEPLSHQIAPIDVQQATVFR